ncbi:MAG TPA: T9SS type A sorting domain-containing protein [Caldithrix abyssi]|uniref:T9SS type A sorting domain-containing protein n=1 Tax=Caldithrix abyssi TaxID=187145 RepID=A0A7V4U0B4_CALAY|nr:T9SS type A sorting domain-containing protein [Caldithrix abyssi]
MKKKVNFFLAVLMLVQISLAKNSEEFRAIWVVTWEHINRYKSASENMANVRKILDNLKAANINAVLWQARQSGTAYYNSSYEPWGYYAGYEYPGYDPLAYAIQEAHKRGIELHAWFNVFQTSSTHDGTIAAEHPEWICTNEDGEFMPKYRSASPGLQAVRDYTVQVAMEIVRNYDIDGLHLDYIRWNEYDEDDMQKAVSEVEQISKLDGMISEEKLNRLSKTTGTKRYIYDVEHPASGGIPDGFSSWDDWRRWSVTEFVRTLQDSIKAVKPWVRLSPAALGKYKKGGTSGWNGYYIVFQDAALWFNKGYIDQLTPMHYHWYTGNSMKEELQDDWKPYIQEGIDAGRLYSNGPGSYMLDELGYWNNHADIVNKVRTLSWVDGFQFFSYASWDKHNYWAEPAETFFAGKARVRSIYDNPDSIPPAPTIALTKVDDMHNDISVSPPVSLDKDYWFAIYRSPDSILSIASDEIVDIHFGRDEHTFTDSYWTGDYFEGTYRYFALMYDRYQIISDISNVVESDSIPMFIKPPSAAPQYVRVLSENDSSLTILCDTVEQATGYQVLVSTDGTHFTDTVRTTYPEIAINGLSAGRAYYFKICAYNQGGLSPYNERLYAGVPSDSATKVLVVNGFDRGTNERFDYIRYYAKPLRERGYGFSYTMNESVIKDKIALNDYKTVIWILGDESTADETFSSAEQSRVKSFLRNGGRLFVSGSEIGWDLGRSGSSSNSDIDFYQKFLKARYKDDAPGGQQSTYYTCQALSNGLFADMSDFSFDNGKHGTIDVDWPDAIEAINGAENILKYKNAPSGSNIAGIVFEGLFPDGQAKGKLIYLAVPFETIYPEDKRIEFMSMAFDFFEGKITDIKSIDAKAPLSFELYQNYPNPFNPSTTIRYQLPKGEEVQLIIYNSLGQKVRTLVAAHLSAGTYETVWNGRNDAGQLVASGVYVYRLKAGKNVQIRRMVFLK